MRFTPAIVAAVLAVSVLAAPVPHSGAVIVRRQLAGEGSACNSALSDTDNGVGHGVENAEDNLAGDSGADQTGSGSPNRHRRQLAGEGSACDSALTDTDSGAGHGIENAEDNLAGDSGADQTGGSNGGGSPPPPPPPPPPGPDRQRRQTDKIAKGAQTLSQAEGTGPETEQTTTTLVNVDGQSTNDAATAGAQFGGDEEDGLEQAGSDVPTPPAAPGTPPAKRQTDKIADGLQTLSQSKGTGGDTAETTTTLVNVDGQSTSDAATAGAQGGDDEETALEQAGSDVPTPPAAPAAPPAKV